MANPQKENGCTDIANELLEAIYSYDFTITQIKIILCVIRFTYGFNRKKHTLSINFIKKAIKSPSKVFVSKEIKKLINDNILIEYSSASFKTVREIGINKDYSCWKKQQLSNYTPVVYLDNPPVVCTDNPPVVYLDNQETKNKETKNKETKNILSKSEKNQINNDLKMKFDIIWGMYPRKVGKNKAFKYYCDWTTKGRKTEINDKKLKLTPYQIFNAVDKYSQEVVDRDEQYIQHGSTFFNTNILDYISEEDDNKMGGELE